MSPFFQIVPVTVICLIKKNYFPDSAVPDMKKSKTDVGEIYKKSMKDLQLIVTEFDHRHHFANKNSSKAPSSATIFRVAQGM